MPKKVWLLTTGDGEDGNEWDVKSIHSNLESAEKAKRHYERPRERFDGSFYNYESHIEEWEVSD